PGARRHQAPRHKQASDQRNVEQELQRRRELDQRQVTAGIFEHHGLVHHGQFEMGGRIVDRNAGIFRHCHHDRGERRAPNRYSQPPSDETRKPAMGESCVEPAISASVKMIMIIAGSASEAIITSRLEPIPPKLVPTSSPANARKKRALPRSATMAMRSADHENKRPVRNGGTNDAATQVAAKMRYGMNRNSHEAFSARTTSLRMRRTRSR